MMQTNLFRCGAIAIALVMTFAGDAVGQRHHHHGLHRWLGARGHHHGLPRYGGAGWLRECVEYPLIWDVVVEIPIVQPWIVPAPAFVPSPVFVPVPAPVPVPVAPAAVRPLGVPPVANVGGENFAHKAIAPPGQVILDPVAFDDEAEIRRRAAVLKTSTPGGRMRADRLISRGDQAFADQVFARATAQYRDAIAKAPDYAEAHFRLAHAYVATRQYNLALKSALVALELAASSRRDGFSLEDLYQGDNFVRRQHLQKLIDASLREPHDGGLAFLLGFTLHYGSEPDKAREYFLTAQRIAGMQQAYVRYFLPVQQVAEPPVAAN
jgi:hypothetical protein